MYTISISGEKAHDTPEQARDFEYGVARLAHEMATKLDGVTTASFGGQHFTHANLLEEPTPPVQRETTEPAADAGESLPVEP